jgi:uncharacterized membrane protein
MYKSKVAQLVGVALFTAIVVVLQLLGAFIKFGPFSVSLVLIPIVVGAALYGYGAGAWLGLVFGITVLLSGDAALFWVIHPVGTVLTCLLKGALAGLCAGLVYHALSRINRYLAVMAAAIVCPIVNTGVFLVGCSIFFLDTLREWASGANVFAYMLVGLVGLNFLFEMVSNLVLSPAALRLINLFKKNV